MNISISSKDIMPLNERTLLILKKAKGAKKAFTLDDIRSLVSDYEKLGADAFFAKAEAFVVRAQVRAPAGNAQKDEFEKKIKKLSASHTEGVKMFIAEILDECRTQLKKDVALKKKDYSIPKIVEAFRMQSTEEELLRLAETVTKRKSRSHASFRQ